MEVKGPEHSSNRQEDASIGHVIPRANSSSSPKGEVRPLGRVGVDAIILIQRVLGQMTRGIKLSGPIVMIMIEGPNLPRVSTHRCSSLIVRVSESLHSLLL